jgi:hypothetical protein
MRRLHTLASSVREADDVIRFGEPYRPFLTENCMPPKSSASAWRRYRPRTGRSSPPEDVPLVRFMVDHELSVSGIAEREAQGESAFSSELIVKLAYPLAYVG